MLFTQYILNTLTLIVTDYSWPTQFIAIVIVFCKENSTCEDSSTCEESRMCEESSTCEESTMCGFAPQCRSETGNYDRLSLVIVLITNKDKQTIKNRTCWDMSREQWWQPASRRSRFQREQNKSWFNSYSLQDTKESHLPLIIERATPGWCPCLYTSHSSFTFSTNMLSNHLTWILDEIAKVW